jgi:enoyl-CoA hydratase
VRRRRDRCDNSRRSRQAFYSGIDLVEDGLSEHKNAKARSKAEANIQQLANTQKFQAAITALADCALPVVAVVQGFCLGAGVDLIAACDIRIASACSVFSVREIRLDLVAELAYIGKDIKADRAEKIGLVNDVYKSPEATIAAVIAFANEIAGNSPMALRGTQFILRMSENLTDEQSLMLNGMFTMMTSLQSNDLQEDIKAFLERRTPKFTGS